MSKSLCCLAFDTLYSKLLPDAPSHTLAAYNKLTNNTYNYPQEAPLFITWDKDEQLRGCIGTFSGLPIESGVKKFALTAAFDDHRFPQISSSELPRLDVSVTLLDNFEEISSYEDWTVGEHGLKVYIKLGGQHFSGTFLPSVAEEQGWDKKTTLWYLLKKADYDAVSKSQTTAFYEKGLKEGWLELVRYSGKKDSMGYNEYEEIRKLI
ncbi:uncharacterized protein CLIB1423_16S01464 [[Candida] railenensis]|uniref:AMMECR1 domain-containing protein n=1 Tax=[Candida] railenensis TaxID=45579 RepID=A0A9P0QSX6_9ASCO|nr:uncharacterized protein CLIB1423_16S01464 [[Candida] railenensis]